MCWSVFYLVALIVVPYITVYALGGMWTKEALVREQPMVRFRYEALVEAHGTASGGSSLKKAWSTSQELNDALGASLRPCSLRAWEEDDERDGLADRLKFVVSMPVDLENDERIHAFSVTLGVDASFATEFQLRLNSSLRMEASSPLAGSSMEQTANLELQSSKPQRSFDLVQREPCPSPVWLLRSPVQPNGNAADTASVLAQYSSCNDTMIAVAQPAVWSPGTSSSFDATLTVRVPSVLTTRRPGVLETLKLAFVQYVTFFIPIAAILSYLHRSLFQLGILSARIHHPVKQHQF
jgi:hypothetical protein